MATTMSDSNKDHGAASQGVRPPVWPFAVVIVNRSPVERRFTRRASDKCRSAQRAQAAPSRAFNRDGFRVIIAPSFADIFFK